MFLAWKGWGNKGVTQNNPMWMPQLTISLTIYLWPLTNKKLPDAHLSHLILLPFQWIGFSFRRISFTVQFVHSFSWESRKVFRRLMYCITAARIMKKPAAKLGVLVPLLSGKTSDLWSDMWFCICSVDIYEVCAAVFFKPQGIPWQLAVIRDSSVERFLGMSCE